MKKANEGNSMSGQEIFDRYGFELGPETLALFQKYHDLLRKENRKVNLTSIEGSEEIYEKHFVDSLMLTKTLELENRSLLDVGSGAGFPGVPLKIVHPRIDLTIIDSTLKRIRFLEKLRAMLGVSFALFHERVEDFDRSHTYDVVAARAVAPLNILVELCLPFVKVGGVFVAYKGKGYHEEIEASFAAIGVLGGRLGKVDVFEVAGADRALVHIEKVEHTPADYPRRFKNIKRNPL